MSDSDSAAGSSVKPFTLVSLICVFCFHPSDCSYTCHLECQSQVQLDCNQRDRQPEKTPSPRSTGSSTTAPQHKVSTCQRQITVHVRQEGRRRRRGRERLFQEIKKQAHESGFVLQHLLKPTLLHNHPPLSQQAAPTPQLSDYEFNMRSFAFCGHRTF